MPRQKPARYEIRTTIRAPLDFVYRWCTDFGPGDGKLAREGYERWVLERSERRVVLEDLEKTSAGWMWRRSDVRLEPPDRWHAESTGNRRDFSLDYRLRALPGNRTEFSLTGVRRAKPLGGPNPPKATLERELRRLWGNLGSALEREYRGSAGRRR